MRRWLIAACVLTCVVLVVLGLADGWGGGDPPRPTPIAPKGESAPDSVPGISGDLAESGAAAQVEEPSALSRLTETDRPLRAGGLADALDRLAGMPDSPERARQCQALAQAAAAAIEVEDGRHSTALHAERLDAAAAMMAASGEADERVFAAVMRASADGEARIDHQALAAAVARPDLTEAGLYAAAQVCAAGQWPGCDMDSMLDRLQRLAPDNAMVWLLRASVASSEASAPREINNALRRAAAATRADDSWSLLLPMAYRAARDYAGLEGYAAFLTAVEPTVRLLSTEQTWWRVCLADAPTRVAARRAECRGAARTLQAHANSALTHGIAESVLLANTDPDSAAHQSVVDAKSRHEALYRDAWAALPLLADQVLLDRFIERLMQADEGAALRDILRQARPCQPELNQVATRVAADGSR